MTVVVVGGGQAGFQTVSSLRDDGYTGAIVLIGDQHLPYQRPPLSKAYLKSPIALEQLHYRPQDFYDRHAITVRQGPAVSIDRAAHTVTLANREHIAYDHLVLATGCRVRKAGVPGEELRGVHYLRDHADAERLVEHLGRARRVTVIGAGFIGLEVAAGARQHGAEVTVLEYSTRAMGRAVSAFVGNYFLERHRQAGTRVQLDTVLQLLDGDGAGNVAAAHTTTGDVIPTDLVVIGIGVQPNAELAEQAGISVDNGIVVDEFLRSIDDPEISAVGDCTRFTDAATGRSVRLESVQNAVDQARCIAKRLTGHAAPYRAVPWFWTDQLGVKLQIAGITTGHDHIEVSGDAATSSFSVFCFEQQRLLGVESVNRPADHLTARRLLAAPDKLADLTPDKVRYPGFTLRAHLAG